MLRRVVTAVVFTLAVSATASAQERLKPGDTFRDCFQCPEMVVVPAGSFTMGSPASENLGRAYRRGPPHEHLLVPGITIG